MTLRQKILNGEIVTGMWSQSGNPVIAEIMADYGHDFIAADMEHGDMNEEAFAHFARAVRGRCAPFARVRENDTIAIRRLLDCGASGIIVPLVNNAEDAKNAVSAAKYPPVGVRGFAFVRANNWGKDFDEYAGTANDNIAIIVMIETKEAVENIDLILSVDGVDGVLVGPYDMSGSYGVAGQTNHPLVEKAKERVLDSCKKYNKAAGQHIVTMTNTNVKEAIEQGYTFLALGMDTVFAADGARKAKDIAANKYRIY